MFLRGEFSLLSGESWQSLRPVPVFSTRIGIRVQPRVSDINTPCQLQYSPGHAILGRRYVRYINQPYGRTGTLWEGRYRASLVEEHKYLLTFVPLYRTIYRYIEMNPVRAAMDTDPAHYPWSSYCHHGLGEADSLITPHPLYLDLAADTKARMAAYRKLG